MELVKFAVWGMGIRGKNLIKILGSKAVCIIESNRQLHNTCFEGIPVISCEEYLDLYSMYPVIITPLGFEHDIRDKLSEKGIDNVFLYSENCHVLDAFRKEGAVDNSISVYDYDKEIIVYGGGILGCLLYNYLAEKGYACKLAQQHNDGRKFLTGTGMVQWKREVIEGAQVILTVPLTDEDRSELDGLDIKCETYYETFWPSVRNFYYYPYLECFRDIHHKKRCFIVGTGPSLRMEDLDKLHQNKEICFSVNGIFAAFDKTKWRPDYYMAGDIKVVSKWRKEIAGTEAGIKFIAEDAGAVIKEKNEDLYRWHIFRNWTEGEMPQFSDDFARGTFTGWTITYDGALQLAVYMGFKEIYLLGVDCNYIRAGRRNHFVEENEPDVLDYHEERMILAYRAAQQYAKSHGIYIYNATRGGMLEEFERVDFDLLMQHKH